MRSVSRRSSSALRVARRAVLALPDHRGLIAGKVVEAHRRRVAAAADEPGRPLVAARRVEHTLVRRGEREAEEPDDRVPEPFGFVDRAAQQRREVGDALGAHEASHVALAQQ